MRFYHLWFLSLFTFILNIIYYLVLFSAKWVYMFITSKEAVRK